MDILAIIQGVGFPIAITIWFMLRLEKIISHNSETLEKLSLVIANCPYKGEQYTTLNA